MLPMNSSTNLEVAKPIPEEPVERLILTALKDNLKTVEKLQNAIKGLLKAVKDVYGQIEELQSQEINNLIIELDQLKAEDNIEVTKSIPQETVKPSLRTDLKDMLKAIKELETSLKDHLKAVEKFYEKIDDLIEQFKSQEVNNLMLEHDQLKEEDKIEVANPISKVTLDLPLLKDILKVEKELVTAVEGNAKAVRRLLEEIGYQIKKEKFKLWGLSIPEIPGLRSLVLKACRTGNWHFCIRAIEEQLDKSYILYKQLRDVREYSRLPWEIACRDHVELLNVLFGHGLPVNLVKPTGYNETMLHTSVRSNQISVAKLLISMGADVNVKDNAGDTPLHDAARNGYIDIAKLLLENKALINATNKKNETPLHYAVQNLHVSIVEYLVDCRCNKLAVDRNKKTALDIAEYAFRRSNDSATFYKFRQIIQILNSC